MNYQKKKILNRIYKFIIVTIIRFWNLKKKGILSV